MIVQSEDFPPELDCAVYRRLHRDLAHMNDNELREHYALHGRTEGRVGNGLTTRESFAALVGREMRALEIGPFAKPILQGPNVVYCDVMDRAELRKRAASVGEDPEKVPPISHVLGSDGLDAIADDFDVVLSSHSIEHQPDLVRHLQQVERRLERRGGRYFLFVPDKRYCFDHFIAPSTIADIVEAYHGKRTAHGLRSVVEHRALTTHNDAVVHWQDDQRRPPIDHTLVARAIEEWQGAQGGYIDVHAWYFMPDSFAENLTLLRRLGLTRLGVERLYATRYGAGEFWAILAIDRPEAGSPT